MRQALNVLDIDGTVVIGEGERDEAPMLYIGEKVGTGQRPEDRHRPRPARGHHDHAPRAAPNAISCIAMAPHGGFLNAPDTYMDKIAVGAGLPPGVDRPHATRRSRTSPALAEAKGLRDRGSASS